MFPYRLIDLTHTITPNAPTWDATPGYRLRVTHNYDPHLTYSFKSTHFSMYCNTGTHVDASAHYIPGGITTDQLAINDLVMPCYIIDVTDSVEKKADY